MSSMFRFLSLPWGKHKKDQKISLYIQEHFGFKPGDTRLYRQALRHSSAVKKGAKGFQGSNERLEFLGDTALDLIVAEFLYDSYDDLSEGELTKMKAKIVSRKTLNSIGDELGIAENLEARLGKQPIHRSMIGNALEAIIGAMYLDKGYKFTNTKVMEILRSHNIENRVHDVTDFKSKLHEWCQKRKVSLTFDVIRENPESNATDRYEIVVFVDEVAQGRGKGKSKKSAEQQAAKEACVKLIKD